MSGWFTKAIRLKLYRADTPSEFPDESLYGAQEIGGIATAYVPNSVEMVRNGETIGQTGGYRVVSNSKILGIEALIRDEEGTRRILNGSTPGMFELTQRNEGDRSGSQILMRGYISYFRVLEVCHEGEPALHVIILTTESGIMEWNDNLVD